jgi:Leucine-rich repeat (LRR) protein
LVNSCKLESEGMDFIFRALNKNNKLKELDLSDNNCLESGDLIASMFKNIVKKTSLNFLYLSHNKIKEKGNNEILAAMKKFN